MSDNDDRARGKKGVFLLGFLLGALVGLGAGGALMAVRVNQELDRQNAAIRRDVEVALEGARRLADTPFVGWEHVADAPPEAAENKAK